VNSLLLSADLWHTAQGWSATAPRHALLVHGHHPFTIGAGLPHGGNRR
jgi:hypothetical protein